jgi:epoxyqueuosine reductase
VNSAERTSLVKSVAMCLGFDRVGIARAAPIRRWSSVRDWLDRGFAGSMAYLHRNVHTRRDPAQMLEDAKSIIVVALNYYQRPAPPPSDAVPRGRIARYAWGRDYHDVVRGKLRQLVNELRRELREPFDSRICVDTAPIVEREIAAAAGIGWVGKNTLVLHQDLGSYFFLGEVITTLELVCDQPTADHCGSCTRCLDACPTHAFPQPHVMDASRCISYLTIEHRGEIPSEMHASVGNWIYGCDVCQEVCPFNRRPPQTTETAFSAREPAPSVPLHEIERWTAEDYTKALAGSAMKRANLEMLKRNAAIALANARKEGPAPP